MQAYLNDSDSVEAVVAFGDELRKLYSPPWTCNDDPAAEKCHSIVYSITLYPRISPYPEMRKGQRLTPIIDVNIFAPTTGKEQKVEGYLNAVQMSLTLSDSPPTERGLKYRTKCYYFSEAQQEWMTDGVHSSGTQNGKATCWSGHLTAFAVIRTSYKVEKGTVVGIVVGAFLAASVFSLLLIWIHNCCQKRQQQSRTRASQQQLADRAAE